MCLTIAIEAPHDEREELEAVAKVTSRFGLHVAINKPSRFLWRKGAPARGVIETWDMSAVRGSPRYRRCAGGGSEGDQPRDKATLRSYICEYCPMNGWSDSFC
jgi:hypothetical protein